MKFSEIKHKIKNLGNFKSLKEIKEAGLRIVRNTKTGDYWLIEKEFLKPVVTNYENLKSIKIEPDMSVFVYPEIDYSKTKYKANDYIVWGKNLKTKGGQKQEAGIPLPKIKSLRGRKYWYSFQPSDDLLSNVFWQKRTGERFAVFFSDNKTFVDQKLYPLIKINKNIENIVIALNSTIQRLFLEVEGVSYTGAYTLIEISVEDVEKLPVINPERLKSKKIKEILRKKEFKSIFTELGFDPSKPIREQEPNPLPDRKALDDIVFDALGLTKEERKEVYWAVAELVKNRLEKARSV